jgi:hypothetical protein
MKKSILWICLVAVLAFTMSGCSINLVTGSGRLSTETRSVSGFSSLLFAGLGDVNITQGSTEGLTIQAEDNVLPKIVTEVRSGGQLYIGFERENWQDLIRPTKGITFTLKVKNLDTIEISGVGNVTVPSFKADQLELKVGGAGNIKFNSVAVTSLTATMSGAGNMDLTGKVNSLSATMSGVGNFSCGDLQAQNVKVSLTGAGGATVWPTSTLDVSITGAGTVGYYGSPKITKNITGLGVLNELGNK